MVTGAVRIIMRSRPTAVVIMTVSMSARRWTWEERINRNYGASCQNKYQQADSEELHWATSSSVISFQASHFNVATSVPFPDHCHYRVF
jgi:hypothetical protein